MHQWNIPTQVTVGSRSSDAGGFNIGGGLTFGVGTTSANIYAEVRYHKAFTANIDTTVLPVTFWLEVVSRANFPKRFMALLV